MISFQKTKRKRASSRRTATILIHRVEEALRKGSDGDEWKKLEHFRDELEERRTELKRLDEEILDTLLEDAEEEEINKENDETNEYREKIGCTILAIKDSLLATSQGKWSRTSSLESLSSLTSTKGGTKKVQVKLPKFNLRPFSGKIHEWQEFWDGFNSAVHQNEDLANVEKLNYLKGFLEEKARHVIAGIPTTDDSYETAINMLTKRFGKPNVIQRAHVNQLISVSPVYSERNVARLRGMHDEIEIHLRGLEALGVDMATYSGFVVPVLMDKIPETMRLNMIRFHEKDQMDWTLQDFLDGFEKEISVRESHVPLKTLTGSTGGSGYSGVGGDRRNRQVPSRDDFGTANALLTERAVAEKNCAYCLHRHDPAECKTVRSTQERKNILRKYARCFVCLMSGHRGFECRSNIICKHCRGKHHTSICNRPKQGASAISLDRESSPKPGSAALNPSATTWVGSTYCGERVALQTALGKVKERKECVVRVLFDAGSHQSFITAKAAGKIGLQAVKQERLSVKTFGKNEVETKVRDIVDFDLSSVNNQQSARIQCYVVDEIATIPNERIDIVKNDFDHLKQIYFSDATKHGETLQVDILIGANFLWEFMSGQIIRGGPQQPVAIKTLLGWTLSGPLKAGKLHYLSHVNVNFVSSMNKSDKQHLDELVHKLWDLDSIGIREGDHVHETLIDNIHFTGEQYQVGLPWKVGHGDLPSNYDISLMRLQCQLKKLRKDPVTLRKYDDIIREQEETGIIEKVPALGNVGRTHYLAHQAVVQEDDWPKTMVLTESEDVKEEQKKCNVLSVMAEKQPRLNEIIDLGRFSALSKLLRVTAWVRRFIDNLRRKKEKQDVVLEPLSATEIEKSETSWVKDSQIDLQQSAEFDKTRTNLDIRQVSDILICHGRLENSDLDLGAKFPMVLPRDHKFTELIIWDCHRKVHHCKVRATLAEVRARFWITKGRQYIKKVLKGCFICKKLEGKAFDAPIMAPLPAFRVSEAPPFSTVGIDFAGPLYCKTKKGMTKCYIALFSCGITRAVHLELVYDLSTPTFICCLRRFCARRGTPSIIVSDNARTFKAAHKLLKKLKTDQTFEGFIGNKRIEWKFNLERSP